MKPLHLVTPLIESLILSDLVEPTVWLKMEALQPSGSFKIRGIGYACQHYLQQGATRFVASSAGNAGLAVAYAGRQLGIPVTVVVPQTSSSVAIERIKRNGADVVVKGADWDSAHEYAQTLLTEQCAYLHPFDDPLLWTGHATLIDELAQVGLRPDGVVVAVGGGGLMCGLVEGMQRYGWDNVPLLAVETIGTDSLYASCQAGERIQLEKITSIASSLGARRVAKQAFEIAQSWPVECHRVADERAVAACRRFVDDHRVLVEPACGAPLSAVYDQADFFIGKKNVLVVVCGGVGVSLQQLLKWSNT
ncbi:MAG TPA: serine dehydratase [Gammaproteobacteria bacterium]|nr:serine dehydratase [Gammaproteobacteria bacterium]